jgi:hypothetical protein
MIGSADGGDGDHVDQKISFSYASTKGCASSTEHCSTIFGKHLTYPNTLPLHFTDRVGPPFSDQVFSFVVFGMPCKCPFGPYKRCQTWPSIAEPQHPYYR